MRIAALLLIYVSSAHSRTLLEQEYLRKLQRVSSQDNIERLQSTYERIHILKIACRMELKEARVPLSCYESIKVETSWGLREPLSIQARQSDLDERCRKAAQSLRLPNYKEDLGSLSKTCLAHVLEARAIEKYRDRSPDAWSEY